MQSLKRGKESEIPLRSCSSACALGARGTLSACALQRPGAGKVSVCFSFFVADSVSGKRCLGLLCFLCHWRCRERSSRQIRSKARSDWASSLLRRPVEAGLVEVNLTFVSGCKRPAGCMCDECHTQLHSVWTRCVSKCFVIPVFEVFHCKGLMSHVPHSAAFGLDQMCFKMFRNSSFLRSSIARDGSDMCRTQLHQMCFHMFRYFSFFRSSIAKGLCHMCHTQLHSV